jgi:hypothetical protein
MSRGLDITLQITCTLLVVVAMAMVFMCCGSGRACGQ